jgi:hypothetical protein
MSVLDLTVDADLIRRRIDRATGRRRPTGT